MYLEILNNWNPQNFPAIATLFNFKFHVQHLGHQRISLCTYHFSWVDQKEKQGYKSDVFLKRAIELGKYKTLI